MPEQGVATQPAKEVRPFAVELSRAADRFEELYDSIRRRAYEIFEGNGRVFGRDLANWFQAETELLHPLHVDVAESGDAVTVKAEVPGFTEKDLEINVDPRRLTISGKRESKEESKTKKTVYSEWRSNQILRVLDLPAEVASEKAKATLKNGILEVEMPKAAPAKKVRIEPKAA